VYLAAAHADVDTGVPTVPVTQRANGGFGYLKAQPAPTPEPPPTNKLGRGSRPWPGAQPPTARAGLVTPERLPPCGRYEPATGPTLPTPV